MFGPPGSKDRRVLLWRLLTSPDRAGTMLLDRYADGLRRPLLLRCGLLDSCAVLSAYGDLLQKWGSMHLADEPPRKGLEPVGHRE